MKARFRSDDRDHDAPNRPKRRARYPGSHPRDYGLRYKELSPSAYPGIHAHVRSQGRTPVGTHVPVLVDQVLAALHLSPGETVVDCTIGYGGHAAELMKAVGPSGRLIGLDWDAAELERTRIRLKSERCVTQPSWPHGATPAVILYRCHFGGIGKVLAGRRLPGCNAILADLGASSMQLDDPSRGFSYKQDGPLDMRMDVRLPRTAADLLATLSLDELSAGLRDLSDEPDHARIARAIVQRRDVQAITRTRQLARLVLDAKRRPSRAASPPDGSAFEQRHGAARTFQALRMMVNDELGGLAQLLRVAPYCLMPGGRLAIISFHSGEHRCIEEAFGDGCRVGLYASVSDEPARATQQEIYNNPRSRSARLYWATRASV